MDPTTGYRYYSAEQLGTGHLIRQLRDCEMPLEQLRVVLQDPGRAQDALLEHRQHLETRMREHQQMLCALDALIVEDNAGLKFRTKLLPARTVLTTAQSMPWLERHEPDHAPQMVALLQARLHRNELHHAPFLMYGCVSLDGELEVQACVQVKDAYGRNGSTRSMTLPPCEVIYTVHQGSYRTIAAALERLLRHALSLNLQPTGVAFETMLSHPATADSVTEYRTELAIPVAPKPEP